MTLSRHWAAAILGYLTAAIGVACLNAGPTTALTQQTSSEQVRTRELIIVNKDDVPVARIAAMGERGVSMILGKDKDRGPAIALTVSELEGSQGAFVKIIASDGHDVRGSASIGTFGGWPIAQLSRYSGQQPLSQITVGGKTSRPGDALTFEFKETTQTWPR